MTKQKQRKTKACHMLNVQNKPVNKTDNRETQRC